MVMSIGWIVVLKMRSMYSTKTAIHPALMNLMHQALSPVRIHITSSVIIGIPVIFTMISTTYQHPCTDRTRGMQSLVMYSRTYSVWKSSLICITISHRLNMKWHPMMEVQGRPSHVTMTFVTSQSITDCTQSVVTSTPRVGCTMETRQEFSTLQPRSVDWILRITSSRFTSPNVVIVPNKK